MTIEQMLHIGGIRRSDPEWGLQFNLLHASLDGKLGVRQGLDHRLKSVLRVRGLGKSTPEGLQEFADKLRGMVRRVEA